MKSNIKLFNDVLTKEEIVFIGRFIKQFENGLITYKELEQKLNENNIAIFPKVRDYSRVKMTIDKAKVVKERISSRNFIPKDLNGYYISSDRYHNVLIRYDIHMIEALANAGEKEEIEKFKEIIEWQKRYIVKARLDNLGYPEVKKRKKWFHRKK